MAAVAHRSIPLATPGHRRGKYGGDSTKNHTRRIRSQHPEVAHTVLWDEAGVTWIQSQVTHDQAQLNTWAWSTMAVETSNHSAEDICNVVEKQCWVESPVEAKSVAIFMAASIDSIESVLGNTTVQFLFHVNHLYFDGISIDLLVGDFVHTLGAQLSARDNDRSSTVNSGPDNLSPPVLDILHPGWEVSGSQFEMYLATFMESTT